MKIAIAFALATVLLAGCTSSGNPTAALDVSTNDGSPPGLVGSDESAAQGPATDESGSKVMAAGTSPISPDIQVAFCQDQVGFVYEAEAHQVMANERVVAADGSTTIDVTIDKGGGDVKTYTCRLDADNRFVDVTATGAGLL
jgi:hypothetical protein